MKPFPWKHREREAAEAAERARKEYEEARAARPYVNRLAHIVRSQREQNHFAEAFRKIVEGR